VIVAALAVAVGTVLWCRPRLWLPPATVNLVPVVALALVVAVQVRPEWVVPLCLAGSAAVLATVVSRRRRAQAARLVSEAKLLEACELLAADLRAGLTPEAALARAALDWAELSAVAAAAELGADVPTALRELASSPGCADLRLVAGSWHVAQQSGSALAVGMTRVAVRLRQARASRAVVRSELASARATARLLAVLPAFSWLMGAGTGGNPVRFLLGSPWGFACLLLGLALDLLGLWWIDRIAASIDGAL
jgi:tight adherence protein B